MESWSKIRRGQKGLSLFGFIFVLVIVAFVAILGLKVGPTVIEYYSIKKAIVNARNAGANVREIQAAFDRQTAAGYIESVSGKDLEITRTAEGLDVSVAYQKKIGLFGPVSLVIDYVATTASMPVKRAD
jgi:hypothetical protein